MLPRALALLAVGIAGPIAGATRWPSPPHPAANDWTIARPPGPSHRRDLAPRVTLSRDGSRAFVVEGGYAPPRCTSSIRRRSRCSRASRCATRSAARLREPRATTLVAGASTNAIVHIDTGAGRVDRTVALGNDFYATSIARSPDGSTLAVTGDLASRVAFVDANAGRVNAVWGPAPIRRRGFFA